MTKCKSLLTATICTMAMILVMALWLGAYGPIWQAAWKAQPSDWLGFLGNIVAGLMTLIAAGIAWLAVQRQIESGREIASLRETDAWLSLKDDLNHDTLGINLFWKSVDRALLEQANIKVRKWRYTNVIEYLNYIPDKSQIENYQSAATDFIATRRRRISTIAMILTELERHGQAYARGPDANHDEDKWRRRRLESIRRYLTLLARQIDKLDTSLGSIVVDRIKAELDDTSVAERYDVLWNETIEWEEAVAARS